MSHRHKLIVVTPAGRKRYLNLLTPYIVNDPSISEWHLWDNCRTEEDRIYIESLARIYSKVKIVKKAERADGTNRSINGFYRNASDNDSFYFKVDDDVVYVKPGTFDRIYQTALITKEDYLWWSPMVVNNAVCSWILKYKSGISIAENVSAQASDYFGWRSPYFALKLHSFFLDQLKHQDLSAFEVSNTEVAGGRFSINFIGFWGEHVSQNVIQFCPPDVDDEEWISAVLPCLKGKKGLVVGDGLASHFSYYTQEQHLLRSDMLKRYYQMTSEIPYEKLYSKLSAKRNIKHFILDKLLARREAGQELSQNSPITLKAKV